MIAVGDTVERFQPHAINENKNSPTGWRFRSSGVGSIGDTYFAMVAVPSKRMEGWSCTLRNMIIRPMEAGEKISNLSVGSVPADGSRTVVYTALKIITC